MKASLAAPDPATQRTRRGRGEEEPQGRSKQPGAAEQNSQMVRTGQLVLLLLVLTVLSPLVLYTRHLSVALDPIHESIESKDLADESIESEDLADESIDSEEQESPLGKKTGEHKNRVLSEVTATDGAGSKGDSLIEQVTSL